MALPQNVNASPGFKGHHPPVLSSGGVYVIANISSRIDALRSANPETTNFTELDTAGSPTTVLNDGYATQEDGDDIHVVAWDTNGTYTYHLFDMDSETWTIIDEEIENPTNNPTFPWASISVRSDGDVIVAYAGDTDQNMGDTKERVDVNVRSGSPPTWSGPTSLDAGGDVHYGNPNCVLGTSDEVHCVWSKQTSTAADPPTSWNQNEGRTIDSSDDSLSNVDVQVGGSTGANLLGFPNAVSYDDGGTQRIIVNGGADAGSTLRTIQAKEGGHDQATDIDLTALASESVSPDIRANGEVGILTTAELSADLHALYSSASDSDLYYTKSTDDGSSWSSAAEEIDGITVNFISANIYVRGADTVMAYVYDDAGTQKYNEKILIAGAAGLPIQTRSVLQAVSRMGHY